MIKRICSITLAITLVVVAVIIPQAPTVGFAGEQPISVTINGERVVFTDQNPVIVDSRTLVPVRGVFEKLGFDVDWAPGTRQAILTSDQYTVVITVGSATFTVNGVNRTLDVPAQIIGDRTMLPIRAVVESVGYFVDWDGPTRTVLITTDDNRQRWNLVLSSQHQIDFPNSILMTWAAQEIRARTNGAINIEHAHADAIGYWIEVWDDVTQGTIDMAIVVPPLAADARFAMLYIPYLITSYEDGKNVWIYGSNFFEILADVMEDNGAELLGIIPGGLMGIGTTMPLNPATVWNFNQPTRELRIRIPSFWTLQTMADVMQLQTVEIPFDRVYASFQIGAIDGWIGGSPELNYLLTRNVLSYYYDFRYMDDSFAIVMNRNVYNSIPENYRAIIFEVMQEASIRVIEMQAERSAYYLQRMRNYGITVFQPTAAQRRQMQDDMIKRGWPQFMDEVGFERNMIDRILQDIR